MGSGVGCQNHLPMKNDRPIADPVELGKCCHRFGSGLYYLKLQTRPHYRNPIVCFPHPYLILHLHAAKLGPGPKFVDYLTMLDYSNTDCLTKRCTGPPSDQMTEHPWTRIVTRSCLVAVESPDSQVDCLATWQLCHT